MPADVQGFLAEVRTHLHLDSQTKDRVMSELQTHFQDKLSDLRGQGLAEREATDEAISSFGEARDVARLMYEAYSRGTWSEAILSLQPHLLVALLFATHLWRQPLVLGTIFAAITLIAIAGWRGGAPVWTYSFTGYALLPPLILATLCRNAPVEAFGVAFRVGAVALLYGLTAASLVASVLRVSRRDWILVSLMLLPLVVIGIWAYTTERAGHFFPGAPGGGPTPHDLWDRSMAWLCAALGLTAAAFVRMRARLLRGAAVLLIGTVTGTLVVRSLCATVSPGGLLGICLVLLLLLVSPLVLHALLEDRGTEHSEEPREAHAS